MSNAEYAGGIKYRFSEKAKEKARIIAEYKYWTKIRRFSPGQYFEYLDRKRLKRHARLLRQSIEAGEIK